MRKLFASIVLAGALGVSLLAQVPGVIRGDTLDAVAANGLTVGDYTRYTDVGFLELGATPPVAGTIGTARALCFDADAEEFFFVFEVPSDWEGASDMNLEVHWHPESGTAIADGETVEWESDYRSRAAGEAIDSGTVVTVTGTHTQSGAGTDKDSLVTQVLLDYDDANQPLTAGDHVLLQLNRDFTNDTYAADACIFQILVSYTSTGISVGGA